MTEEEREAFRNKFGIIHGGVLRARWGVLLFPAFFAPSILAFILIFFFVNSAGTATTFGMAVALCVAFAVALTKFIPRKVNIIVGILLLSTIIGLGLLAISWFWVLLIIPILYYSFKAIPANCNHPDFYTLEPGEAETMREEQEEAEEVQRAKPKPVRKKSPETKIQHDQGYGSWVTITNSVKGEQGIALEFKNQRKKLPSHFRIRAVDENDKIIDIM